jgi:hypothetical protein
VPIGTTWALRGSFFLIQAAALDFAINRDGGRDIDPTPPGVTD